MAVQEFTIEWLTSGNRISKRLPRAKHDQLDVVRSSETSVCLSVSLSACLPSIFLWQRAYKFGVQLFIPLQVAMYETISLKFP
jgi:hypothetical protein